MRILITGHKGLVGRNVVSALSSDHEVFTLDMSHYFSDWVQRDMPEQLDQKPEVIVHIGGIMSPQTQDPNIYLWNSSAVHLLCGGIRWRGLTHESPCHRWCRIHRFPYCRPAISIRLSRPNP